MDFHFPIGISLSCHIIMYQLLQRGKFEIGKCLVSTFQLDSNGFPLSSQNPIGIQLTIGLESNWKVETACSSIGLLLVSMLVPGTVSYIIEDVYRTTVHK